MQSFSCDVGTFFVGGETTPTATGRRTFAVARQACNILAPIAAVAAAATTWNEAVVCCHAYSDDGVMEWRVLQYALLYLDACAACVSTVES